MPPGIEDVARAAGVSTATVSRALRGLPDVRASTREHVTRIARELGYVPTPSAASLASGRTRTIGLLTPWVARWFHSNVLEGAGRVLRARSFAALLCTFDATNIDPERPRIDPDVLRRRVDALLVVGLTMTEAEVELLTSLKVPLVFAGSGPEDQVRVHVDDEATARTAVQHLLDLGHRRIGHISGYPGQVTPWASEVARATGYRWALRSAGIEPDPTLTAFARFERASACESALRMFDAGARLTAIFADSDEMAFGVLDAARTRGLSVPGDLSVIGVDGHNLGDLIGLTTVAQDAVGVGEAAASLALEMTTDAPAVRDLVVPSELLARGSTRAI